MPTPRFKVGLGNKVLSRARIIFSVLLTLFLIFTLAAVHTGVQSGDFDKIFIAPFRQFSNDLQKAAQSSPIPLPTLLPSPSLSPTPKATQKPAAKPPTQPKQPVVSNCITKNIREGEFSSNKCYSTQDYEDLQYYLQRFAGAEFDLRSAEGTIKITCNCRVQQECDFFKNSCDEAKAKKGQADSDIGKYRSIIQGIIAKGK